MLYFTISYIVMMLTMRKSHACFRPRLRPFWLHRPFSCWRVSCLRVGLINRVGQLSTREQTSVDIVGDQIIAPFHLLVHRLPDFPTQAQLWELWQAHWLWSPAPVRWWATDTCILHICSNPLTYLHASFCRTVPDVDNLTSSPNAQFTTLPEPSCH